MIRFEPLSFRPFFGMAAVAMTALTIAVAVFVPVSLSPLGGEPTTSAKRAAEATQVAIKPARIEVIGIRAKGRA